MLRLNIGCGDLKAPAPWVNVDVNPGTEPDMVGDLRSLPLPSRSAAAIYCGHVLEHLPLGDVPDALMAMWCLLEPGGGLCIVGPDYDRALAHPEGDEVLLRLIREGGGRWSGDEHLWLSTERTTLAMAREVFPDVHSLPDTDVPGDWPVAFRGIFWQFAIVATKEA